MSTPPIFALDAIGSATRLEVLPRASATPAPAAPGFSNWIGTELQELNSKLDVAEKGLQQLAAGEAQSLHEVMLQLEQARLAMQLAAQVRSRVVEAYQEVMRMQV